MARLTHRYTRERSDERVRNFRERLRMGDHEDQSTSDESELPFAISIDFGWAGAVGGVAGAAF